jgi:hypothetical protein
MPGNFFALGLVTIFVLWIVSCSEFEPDVVIKRIPEEERFIYEKGDPVIYACSDGSVDTLRVKGVNFYTHSFSEEDFFGILRHYRIDYGKITLEFSDSTWLRILYYACFDTLDCNPCVNIEADGFVDDLPSTSVYFGCGEYGGLVFAGGLPLENEIMLNGQSYSNVYSRSIVDFQLMGEFTMHWSLKYGIIQFEGEIGDTTYSWDLDLEAMD